MCCPLRQRMLLCKKFMTFYLFLLCVWQVKICQKNSTAKLQENEIINFFFKKFSSTSYLFTIQEKKLLRGRFSRQIKIKNLLVYPISPKFQISRIDKIAIFQFFDTFQFINAPFLMNMSKNMKFGLDFLDQLFQ